MAFAYEGAMPTASAEIFTFSRSVSTKRTAIVYKMFIQFYSILGITESSIEHDLLMSQSLKDTVDKSAYEHQWAVKLWL